MGRSFLLMLGVIPLLMAGVPEVGLAEDGACAGHGARYLRYMTLADGLFASDDAALGVTARFALAEDVGLGSFVHFSLRPGHKTVSVLVREHYRLQLREQRFLLGLGFDEDLPMASFAGLYLTGGAGYTFADYEGTGRRPIEGWTALMGTGLSLRWMWDPEVEGVARIGYRYADLEHTEKNWFHIAIGARF